MSAMRSASDTDAPPGNPPLRRGMRRLGDGTGTFIRMIGRAARGNNQTDVALLLKPGKILRADRVDGVGRVALTMQRALEVHGRSCRIYVGAAQGRWRMITSLFNEMRWSASYYAYALAFLCMARKARLRIGLNITNAALLAPTGMLTYHINPCYLGMYHRSSWARRRWHRARFLFSSHAVLGEFLTWYPDFPRRQVGILHHAVDTELFRPVALPGPTGPVLRAVFVGQWNEEKGISVLLDAAAILESWHAPVYISIAGTALLWATEDGESRARRVDRSVAARCAGLANVTVLGHVPHEHLPALFQSHHLLVCPSTWPDPFPQVVLEAMACGLPVIGSKIGGIPEQVLDGETGWLAPPGDAHALALTMLEASKHPARRAAFGLAGRVRAERLFGLHEHGRRILELAETAEWPLVPGV